ncbi:MAG: chorismate mutase [Acholeplasmataceae bacterium]|nr:chorismate mutase [Acholeplasmataceae bacterium]
MSIEKYRTQIDLIDQEMMELFKKRMELSKLIGEYKKVNQLPIFDEKREREILLKRKSLLNDEKLWPYYELFINQIFNLSKAYQHDQ